MYLFALQLGQTLSFTDNTLIFWRPTPYARMPLTKCFKVFPKSVVYVYTGRSVGDPSALIGEKAKTYGIRK